MSQLQLRKEPSRPLVQPPFRENEGDLHEGFNLGLDPSIADTLPSFQELKRQQAQKSGTSDGKQDGLEHGANLWPSPEVWNGADQFVSLFGT